MSTKSKIKSVVLSFDTELQLNVSDECGSVEPFHPEVQSSAASTPPRPEPAASTEHIKKTFC